MSFLNIRMFSTRVLARVVTINDVVAPVSVTQVRNFAARRGTRERKQKKKVKVEIQKVGFIPHTERNKDKFLAMRPKKKFDDSWRYSPIDDVYVAKYYRWKVYDFVEAVECHRETHHPEMYNKPEADLHVTVELYMQGEKPTRFVDNFTRIVAVPHCFDHGEERSVIAFSKTRELQQAAQEAGAQLSGGVELIKQAQNGQINLQDIKYVVAHPDILPELVQLRGLLKRRFPNPKAGTLDVDLPAMVQRFLHGINYTATKDEHEKDFGIIETIIGKIDMDPKQLEANFRSLVQDIYQMKPKRKGHFISRCILWSPPSQEKFKVDHNLYLAQDEKTDGDEKEVGERVAL